MQEAVATDTVVTLRRGRVTADEKRGNLERVAQHFNSIYTGRALRKTIITYDQIGPLADLGKLLHCFTVGFRSYHPAAPRAQQATGCLEDKRIVFDHDNKLAGAWCFHVAVRHRFAINVLLRVENKAAGSHQRHVPSF